MTSQTICYQIKSDQDVWRISFSESEQDGSSDTARYCHKCRTEKKPCDNMTDCAIVQNLERHADKFSQLASYDQVKVKVTLGENIHTYAEMPAQRLLSSLAGLVIARSQGCEVTQILKPMVSFHRPFSSFEESTYRSIANAALVYLLGNREQTFEEYLTGRYKELHQLNASIVSHFQKNHPNWEALINAMVNLDLFVKAILFNAKADFPDLDTIKELLK